MWIFNTQTFLKFSCSDRILPVFFQECSGLGTKLLSSFLRKNLVLDGNSTANFSNHLHKVARWQLQRGSHYKEVHGQWRNDSVASGCFYKSQHKIIIIYWFWYFCIILKFSFIYLKLLDMDFKNYFPTSNKRVLSDQSENEEESKS